MRETSWIGVVLILLGVAFLLVPAVGRFLSFENIPSWLIYVYKGDNFVFITSPLLIVASLVVFVLKVLFR